MRNITKKLIGGTLLASSLLFSNYVKGQKPNLDDKEITKHYYEYRNGAKVEVWEYNEKKNGNNSRTVHKYNPKTDGESVTGYLIKCKDIFENSPAPDQCSIVVRAFEL